MFLYVRSLEEQRPAIWEGLASLPEILPASQASESCAAPDLVEEENGNSQLPAAVPEAENLQGGGDEVKEPEAEPQLENSAMQVLFLWGEALPLPLLAALALPFAYLCFSSCDAL